MFQLPFGFIREAFWVSLASLTLNPLGSCLHEAQDPRLQMLQR